MKEPPTKIEHFTVREYGYFTRPILPTGYVPPANGRPPLDPIQNLAICSADGVDGFYLLYCTPHWRRVTSSFYETIEFTKKDPSVEFGVNVIHWKKMADPVGTDNDRAAPGRV